MQNHSLTFIGILISGLLIFGVYAFHLSHRADIQLRSDKAYYEIMVDTSSTSNRLEEAPVTLASSENSSGAGRQNSSNINAVVSWNQLITTIALQGKISAPYLARLYALVHVAIYDALLQSTDSNKGNRKPVETAIVAGAAAEIARYLFPENFSSIAALEEQQITHIQGKDIAQIIDGRKIGHDVGKRVIAYAKTDYDSNSFDTRWNETVPSGVGIWTGTDPIGPLFGHQKTYILSSGAEFQPPPPYPFGSANDLADVQAVIDAANSRTSEEISIVHKWADLPPPTIWNEMLNKEIESRNITTYESARALAYLNTAMYDSFVSCWYTKFTYWTARPFQRILSDPTFTTVIPTPNFPSYTSGHSTVSSAAALILGQLFPDKAIYFLSQAHEAAMSRLWAGIHFPQDNNNGFAVGQQIGKKYVYDMLKPPQPFVVPVKEDVAAPLTWSNND